MRDTTERPEGVEAGTLKLVGTDEEVIYNEFTKLLDSKDEYTKMAKAVNPYGDGHVCERITDMIESKEYKERKNRPPLPKPRKGTRTYIFLFFIIPDGKSDL